MATGSRCTGGLYLLNGHQPTHENAHFAKATPNLEIWNYCLFHVSHASILHMINKQMALGMPTDVSTNPAMCDHCILGKQKKIPIPHMKLRGLLDKFSHISLGRRMYLQVENLMLTTL